MEASTYTVEIRNSAGALLVMLENAGEIAYLQAINQADILRFTLPADDDEAAHIIKANELWLRDNRDGSVVRKFLLQRKVDMRVGAQILIHVEAMDYMVQLAGETVLAYSCDDDTIAVIVAALFAFQEQATPITVGTIAAAYIGLTRSVQSDGDSILTVLRKLRETVGGYITVSDARVLDWSETIGEDKGQQIRYRKNLTGITRDINYATLVNRLYCYGEGEGDARIKLSDADGHADDFVEDGASQAAWGGIYIGKEVDRSITAPNTLLAWANLRLAELKDPPTSYLIETIDLSAHDGFDFDALQIGSLVNVIDEDLGIDVDVYVVRIEHPNLLNPQVMVIELATRMRDIIDSLTAVYDIQQFEQHIATKIGAGQVIVLGAFTVLDWATGAATTIDGSNMETGTILIGALNFTPLTSVGATGAIIATINASAEGGGTLNISAAKIAISGSCTFTAGYDPTTKVPAAGAAADVNANVTTITGGKITTNTITLNTLVASTMTAKILTMGAGGIIQSTDYVADTSGWKIGGDGNAEFNVVKVRGSIYTSSIIGGNTLTVTGTILAGAGGIIIDSTGLTVKGQVIFLQHTDADNKGWLFGNASGLNLQADDGENIIISTYSTGDVLFGLTTGYAVRSVGNNDIDLGDPTHVWRDAYISEIKLRTDQKISVAAGNITIDPVDNVIVSVGAGDAFRSDSDNACDLGGNSYVWRDAYISEIKLRDDQTISCSTSMTIDVAIDLIFDGQAFRPIGDGADDLGDGTHKWRAIYRDNEYTCPMPTSNSAIGIFKKIKAPTISDGTYGRRHYFDPKDFPREMKNFTTRPRKLDIELTRTIGVSVQAIREIIQRVEALEAAVAVV